jgi:asparagine synthase (glutamine-hydrolysing)
MCGIAGIIGRDLERLAGSLGPMVAAQVHRGPDDGGDFVEPVGAVVLGLGQRRLSILDLSPEGHQPMVHPGTGDVLVYNGEIYNFQSLRKDLEARGETFRGHSDTEVLLHGLALDGESFVERLEGMYAFAYLSRAASRLLLCRDPLGIKPLYTARTPDGLAFASEVRALMAGGLVKAEPEPRAVASYLAYGAVHEPYTIMKGVRAFPCGSVQWIDLASKEPGQGPGPTRFWRYPASESIEPGDAVQRVREVMDLSVRDHMVADVPVGVFLSSGLDSTILASLAARHYSDINTFTVGFSDDPDMSEADLATQTAERLGTKHTNLSITGDDALKLVSSWLDGLDQPSMDGLNVYVISKLVRGAGITVALSGQGGDEMFGGYFAFADVPRIRRMLAPLRWLPPGARAPIVGLAGIGKPKAYRHKLEDMARSRGDILSLYLHRRRALADAQLAELGVDAKGLGLHPCFVPPELVEDVPADDRDVVWSVSRLESNFYMRNMLLRDGDANGMAHSLEIRVPFLDQRLVDLMLSIPGPVRLPNGKADKHLLRESFPGMLPDAVARQKKRAFNLPIKRWMLGPLREHCESSLEAFKRSGLVNPDGIDRAWRSYLNEPESPMWTRAWALCVMGAYLRRHFG